MKLAGILWLAMSGAALAQAPFTRALDRVDGLKAHKTAVAAATHQGRAAVRVTSAAEFAGENEDKLVLIAGTEDFTDGTIEIDVAGRPGPGASGQARGFVGVAFHVAPDISKFDCIYLRPTNGRADDQVRRNHSVQYISYPEYPWARSRKETPEKYESYVDLEPGVWTKVRITVRGEQARLYVHGNAQPTLIVNDLKQGAGAKGAVALWIGPGTEAHFSNLRISR